MNKVSHKSIVKCRLRPPKYTRRQIKEFLAALALILISGLGIAMSQGLQSPTAAAFSSAWRSNVFHYPSSSPDVLEGFVVSLRNRSNT